MRKQRRTLLAGLALILISNAVVLAMAAYNRQGAPDSRVQLTERELRLPPVLGLGNEDSGIELLLVFRVKGLEDGGRSFAGLQAAVPWLDRDKMLALGFDPKPPVDASDLRAQYTAWTTRREVILVLEYDGDAYREVVRRAEQRLADEEGVPAPQSDAPVSRAPPGEGSEWLERLRQSETRLYVIDAGLDRARLRQRYADTSRYLLMKGTVGWSMSADDGRNELQGVIHGLLLDRVHLPASFRAPLQPFLGGDRGWELAGPPRYVVTFNLGRRLEPWVSEIMPLPGAAD